MATSSRPRSRRPKAQVQEEFDQIQEELADAKQTTLSKDQQLARLRETEVRQAVENTSVETVVHGVSGLNLEISQALADLSSKLVSEVSRLGELREAVALETKELERLHKLDVAKTSLDILVEEYRTEKEKLEQDMAAQREAWAQEKQQYLREQKDFEETAKKQRQREIEDYEYKKALDRKKAQDKYEEELRVLEKSNKEKQETLERSWQERETILKAKEEEVAHLQQEVAAFPPRLKEERERAWAEATAQTKQNYEQQIVLLRKDSEAERKMSALHIKTFEELAARQTTQIELLSRQLDEAKQQVQDIAVKAIEGASGAKALAHINQIAMEQAKPRAGQS